MGGHKFTLIQLRFVQELHVRISSYNSAVSVFAQPKPAPVLAAVNKPITVPGKRVFPKTPASSNTVTNTSTNSSLLSSSSNKKNRYSHHACTHTHTQNAPPFILTDICVVPTATTPQSLQRRRTMKILSWRMRWRRYGCYQDTYNIVVATYSEWGFLIWPRWSQVRTRPQRLRWRLHLSNVAAVHPNQQRLPLARLKKEHQQAALAEGGKERVTPTHRQTRSTAKCQNKRMTKGQSDRSTCKGKEMECSDVEHKSKWVTASALY